MRRSSALLLVTILAACSPQPSGSASPLASSAKPTSTPVASPSPAPSPSPSLAPTEWTEAFRADLTILNAVVAGPSGLIAVGCAADANGSCVRAVLLTSSDGASWAPVDLEAADSAFISRVSRVGDRMFALGYRIDEQRAELRTIGWTSLDGRSWSRIGSASFLNMAINDVIDSPDGVLAVGINAPYASEGFGFVVWDVQADGSFGAPRDVHPSGMPGFVVGAAWTGDRFLAWGPGGHLGDKVSSTILLASPHGRAWTVLPEVSAFHGSSVSQIIAVGNRLIAVGYEGTSQPTTPRAWTSSDDGATWIAAEVPSDAGALYNVQVEASQLLARGEDQSGTQARPLSWSSADGAAWTRLPDGEDMPALAGFKALSRAVIDGRACVAGTFYGDPRRPEPQAAIYCR